jgi:hypothetical protein
VSIANLRDENLRRLYDNIRNQVDSDRGSRHKFTAGASVRQYADALREEMTRRRLPHSLIEWDHQD